MSFDEDLTTTIARIRGSLLDLGLRLTSDRVQLWIRKAHAATVQDAGDLKPTPTLYDLPKPALDVFANRLELEELTQWKQQQDKTA